jgi:hypothetical protein
LKQSNTSEDYGVLKMKLADSEKKLAVYNSNMENLRILLNQMSSIVGVDNDLPLEEHNNLLKKYLEEKESHKKVS